VAAGKFRVTRVVLHVSEGGREIPNLKFWVSLAQDAERTPVLIEAEVPFGTVRVELTSKLSVGMLQPRSRRSGLGKSCPYSSDGLQSVGGKSICQNLGEGDVNSRPTSVFPRWTVPL
jgi:hypothetical protein